MKRKSDGFGYNERLFSGGIRSYFHFARFKWLASELRRINCPIVSVLELGCFDGRAIEFLPKPPSKYRGFDAGWEGGLKLAQQKWHGEPRFSFHKACAPEEISLANDERFDIAISMETLEHVPPEMVDEYLHKISQHLDGYLFVTVPNEKGLPLFVKWLLKKILRMEGEPYALSELANGVIGRLHKVRRGQHKGFDYEDLVREMSKYFDIISVTGHPLGLLPASLCFGVGITARARPRTA